LGQPKNMTNGLNSSLRHTLSNTTWYIDEIQNGGGVGCHIGKKREKSL